MPGPVALVGAGEFLPAMAEFDAGLLASTGPVAAAGRRSCRPPPTPTARRSSPRWAAMGVGALRRRSAPRSSRSSSATAPTPTIAAAAQAIGEADLIYLSGGKPGLPDRARSTAAPSAGRSSTRTSAARPGRLLGRGDGPGRPRLRLPAAAGCPGRCAGATGSGFVAGASVLPHYDAWPEPLSALIALQAPRGSVVLGIDEETAVVGRDGVVAGPRPVAGHGLAGPPPRRYRAGEIVPDRYARAERRATRQSGRASSASAPTGSVSPGLTVRKQSEQ